MNSLLHKKLGSYCFHVFSLTPLYVLKKWHIRPYCSNTYIKSKSFFLIEKKYL